MSLARGLRNLEFSYRLSSNAPLARTGLPTATAGHRLTTTDLARVPHIVRRLRGRDGEVNPGSDANIRCGGCGIWIHGVGSERRADSGEQGADRELRASGDIAVVPPLRGPTRQNAARGKNRATSVGMTDRGVTQEDPKRARIIVPLQEERQPKRAGPFGRLRASKAGPYKGIIAVSGW